MAPSSAFPCPRSSISFSFIFSMCSSCNLLNTAVLLTPAASPVPPARPPSLVSFVSFPHPCFPEEGSTTSTLPQVAPPRAYSLGLLLQSQPSLASPGPLAPYRMLHWQKQSQKLRGGPRSKEPQQAGCQRTSSRRDTSREGDSGLQGQPGPESWRSTSLGAMAGLCTYRGKHTAKQKLREESQHCFSQRNIRLTIKFHQQLSLPL